MKKVSVILLLCIYTLATMGFSLKEFYCCGKLKSITVAFADNGKTSCKNGNSQDDNCCKNKFQYFKIKDNHVTAAHVSVPVLHSIGFELYYASFEHIVFASQKPAIAYQSHAPPMHTGVPVYISNCVFRI
ncbi:HYC_CC_PP family protein [Flavisolibacter nicotianae]|uniref:HYC_CC_PP family protein n=1 Tax=Flavisolibacter nicotianae TaxID=2364882 RepID=UPI0013C46CD6|nr:hypothetical protein [Flavisolibacter nicotianae]